MADCPPARQSRLDLRKLQETPEASGKACRDRELAGNPVSSKLLVRRAASLRAQRATSRHFHHMR